MQIIDKDHFCFPCNQNTYDYILLHNRLCKCYHMPKHKFNILINGQTVKEIFLEPGDKISLINGEVKVIKESENLHE